MLEIRNETQDSAEIYIGGTIIDDEDGNWLKRFGEDLDGYRFPAELKRQLDGLEDKDLTIYINSYGGSIPAGVAMAHMLERHKGKTTAVVDGYCCSIATQIFFSADVCKMYGNACLMVHKPWTVEIGNADDMRKAADILDTLQDGLEVVYQKKAKSEVTSEEIKKMVNAETWLTGAEAAEKFQIELLDSKPSMNCVGSMDKLKAIGARKIPKLQFSSEDKDAPKDDILAKMKIARAKAKGDVWR